MSSSYARWGGRGEREGGGVGGGETADHVLYTQYCTLQVRKGMTTFFMLF
jgi:hypothetical protein